MAKKDGDSGIKYIAKDTPIHRLTGASKLLMVLFVSLACMFTFDTRFLAAVIIASFVMFWISRLTFKDIKVILSLLFIFLLLNNFFIFLFSPEEGVSIYGTRVELGHIAGNYYITREQLFYQLNVTLKYFAVVPLALIFIVTTEPSEFAASLNAIGVSYRAAYSVSLALRYIPGVQREFREISQAQQARGTDISKKVKLTRRVKGIASILFPLIITSIDKIETVANAMELRGFGKGKRRTWYRSRPFRAADYLTVAVSALLIGVSLLCNALNGGRFYNPFM
jgi:energy-coupling factor transport system permease protein